MSSRRAAASASWPNCAPTSCRTTAATPSKPMTTCVSQVRLITNNPEKVAALEEGGISVVERVSAEVVPQESFEKYLKTKHEKMGHIIESLVTEEQPG